MFHIINSFVPNAPEYNGFSENIDERKAEIQRRKKIVQNFVKNLGLQAGVDRIKVEALEAIPSEGEFGYAVDSTTYKNGHDVMELPIHCFLDLAKDFQIHNLHDLENKLQDSEWVVNVVRVIIEIMGGADSPAEEFVELFKPVLRRIAEYLMNNPEKAFDGDRFAILHEFGHIQNEDAARLNLKTVLQVFGTCVLTCVFGLTTACITLAAVFLALETVFFFFMILTPATLAVSTVIALAVALAVALVVEMVVAGILLIHCKGGLQERAADHFATNAFAGPEGEKIRQGGIYLFESIASHEGHVENESCMSFLKRVLWDPHPLLEARIEMLRNFVPENNPNLQPVLV